MKGLATISEAIAALTADFRQAGLPTPELDARLLVLDAAGLTYENFILDPRQPLSMDAEKCLADYRARRLKYEPVSRITGFREFWGRSFEVNPGVLDPRPDTETLIEAVLQITQEEGHSPGSLKLLDLGTGSGCILLTLLAELPGAWGVGVDIETQAVATARRNAKTLELDDRSVFLCGDLFHALHGAFSLIISNPPYIKRQDIALLDPAVRDYDPHRALDGGVDGLDFYRRLIAQAAQYLTPDGWLIMEMGAGQASQLPDLLDAGGWLLDPKSCRIYRDIAGIDRVVALKRQEAV